MPTRPDSPSPRLLIVDDCVDMTASLAQLLQWLGYETVVAHCGHDALRLAECADPDVVLLDIGLPDMDGWEVARRLRHARPDGDQPAVVAVTGYAGQAERERSRAAGFDGHLVKPFDLGELQTLLEGLVRRPALAHGV